MGTNTVPVCMQLVERLRKETGIKWSQDACLSLGSMQRACEHVDTRQHQDKLHMR